MADVSRFRSALNGFNRTDVVNYVESTALAHQKQLRQAQEAQEQLRAENAALEEKICTLEKQLADAETALTAQTAAQDEEATAPVEPSAGMDAADEELAAYRRAAQTEQAAALRAKKLQTQISALCAQAREHYQDSGEAISALSAELSDGIDRLQELLTELTLIFEQSESAFAALDIPEFSEEEE